MLNETSYLSQNKYAAYKKYSQETQQLTQKSTNCSHRSMF